MNAIVFLRVTTGSIHHEVKVGGMNIWNIFGTIFCFNLRICWFPKSLSIWIWPLNHLQHHFPNFVSVMFQRQTMFTFVFGVENDQHLHSVFHMQYSVALMHYRSAILGRRPADEFDSCRFMPTYMALTMVQLPVVVTLVISFIHSGCFCECEQMHTTIAKPFVCGSCSNKSRVAFLAIRTCLCFLTMNLWKWKDGELAFMGRERQGNMHETCVRNAMCTILAIVAWEPASAGASNATNGWGLEISDAFQKKCCKRCLQLLLPQQHFRPHFWFWKSVCDWNCQFAPNHTNRPLIPCKMLSVVNMEKWPPIAYRFTNHP